MKHFIHLFLTLFLAFSLSEIKSQVPDTLVPKIKNPDKVLRKIDIRSITQNGFNFWNDRFSGHWAGIHLGFNGFAKADYTGYNTRFMENELLRSNSILINPIQQSIGLQGNKNTVGLVTGLGFLFQNYRLNKNMSLQEDASGNVMPKPLINYDASQKSKFSIVYITVPLLAEVQIPVKNYQTRFHFSAGAFAGLRINSYANIKYRENGKREKLKTPDDYSISKFKYGLMASTGYRWANLFVTYDLVPLFDKDKGPLLTPFSFGFTLFSF